MHGEVICLTDNLTKEKRSTVMASIHGSRTKPELIFKELVDGRIIRFHPNMFGNPDFGNKSRKIAIFIDGCFWHGCPKCYRAPTTNNEYWSKKFERNKKNDSKISEELIKEGFVVLRFWEHEINSDPLACARRTMEAVISLQTRTS